MSRSNSSSGCVSVVGLALVILIVVGVGLFKLTTTHSETVTVSDKDRVCSGGRNGSCRYLVWTDRGVFENTDTLFGWKFDSSDVQGQLKIGHRYTVTVRGWRVGITSSYPNIVAVENEQPVTGGGT